jgi:N-acetyl-anhydromuramyl-L-alanine amidase AmpD
MQVRDAATFDEIFGAHADELLRVTNAPGPPSREVPGGRSARVQPIGGADLWEEPWLGRFRRAANHRPFQVLQEELAIETFLEPMRQFAAWLGLDTDRALSMVVDRAIQMGQSGARRWIIEVVGPVRTRSQREQALAALGHPNLRSFQEATEGLEVDGAWGPFSHAAMVAALRALDASPIQIPTREEMMDAMVRQSADTRWGHRVRELRNSDEFNDIPYADLSDVTPPGGALPAGDRTVRVEVQNRVFDETVTGMNVEITEGANVVSQEITDQQGRVTLSLVDVPDGTYRFRVTPADSNQRYDGRALPDIAAPPNQPDRIWRTLDTDLSVRGGRVISVRDPDVSVSGNRLIVNLQPVWIKAHRDNRRSRPVGVDITLIVVHHTAGSSSVPPHFVNPPPHSAAHYVIATDGQVVKMVHESEQAFHAGHSHWANRDFVNGFSIGIEIVHRIGSYTPEQYTALLSLLNQIRARHPTIPPDGVIGHSDIATTEPPFSATEPRRLGVRRPEDPGLEFDWPRFEDSGLGIRVRAGPHLPTSYGGFFQVEPQGRLRRGDNDANHVYDGVRRPDLTAAVVEELQEDLSNIGYFCPIDGTFGRQTEGAVRMFQVRFFTGRRRRPDRDFQQNYGRVDRLTAEMIKSVR